MVEAARIRHSMPSLKLYLQINDRQLIPTHSPYHKNIRKSYSLLPSDDFMAIATRADSACTSGMSGDRKSTAYNGDMDDKLSVKSHEIKRKSSSNYSESLGSESSEHSYGHSLCFPGYSTRLGSCKSIEGNKRLY